VCPLAGMVYGGGGGQKRDWGGRSTCFLRFRSCLGEEDSEKSSGSNTGSMTEREMKGGMRKLESSKISKSKSRTSLRPSVCAQKRREGFSVGPTVKGGGDSSGT